MEPLRKICEDNKLNLSFTEKEHINASRFLFSPSKKKVNVVKAKINSIEDEKFLLQCVVTLTSCLSLEAKKNVKFSYDHFTGQRTT